MGLSGFDEINQIKDSNRNDWISGSDLQKIREDTGSLNNTLYSDLHYDTDETLTGNLDCEDLVIYNGGRVSGGSDYDIIVRGNLTLSNGRINCKRLEVFGDIVVKRRAGDTSYVNLFYVYQLICHGNVTIDYCDFIIYDGYSITSTSINKVAGNLSITNDESTNQRWFAVQMDIKGDFYCDNVTISYLTSTSGQITSQQSFHWSIGGDCEFDGLTTMTFTNCWPAPKMSVAGEVIFSEASVSIVLNGADGLTSGAPSNASGVGGGYIGAPAISGSADGIAGTMNGGGSGARNLGTSSYTGGAGAGNGGNGGSVTTGGDAIYGASCGGGGGGGVDFEFYYGTGDTGSTLTIQSIGGAGGSSYAAVTTVVTGGDGGDGGDIVVTYDSVAMGTLTQTSTGGAGGVFAGGGGSGSSGSAGSAGSNSHTSGQSPLVIHLPYKPTFSTADESTVSAIVFNVPVDLNGTALDFQVTVEEKITETIWLSVYDHNSNDNAAYFDGEPYTEGTGTATYTPPSTDLTSGSIYRIRVWALKDTDVTLKGIGSEFLTFTYA